MTSCRVFVSIRSVKLVRRHGFRQRFLMIRRFLGLLTLAFLPNLMATPEAFEIGRRQVSELPKGKEADGILGDFVLRNDVVEALISHNAPNRRANMTSFYGADGTTPGCLYDLGLRGAANDQITLFSPLGQRGNVSYVRIVESGDDGRAVVETKVSSAINEGVEVTHGYHLRDGWQGVLIVSKVLNKTNQAHVFKAADTWKSFDSARVGTLEGIQWADAVDPADKAGYAYTWCKEEGSVLPSGSEVSLKPGESIQLARFLAVGTSPAHAVGLVAARNGDTGRFVRKLVDASGEPVVRATLQIHYQSGNKEKILPACPDEQGVIDLALPVGKHKMTIRDHGRSSQSFEATIAAEQKDEATLTLGAVSQVRLAIHDDIGRSTPCKVQFIGISGTPSPKLGPNNRAHGCLDQYHSETGAFAVPLDPGRYRVVVTRGIEYSHLSKEILLEQGAEVEITGVLKRLVQTPGWVSADFHNHSTPSGDNTCGTDDRMINLAAEHIEFAPTTEHNRSYDWRPHLKKLKLTDYIQTVPGVELTGSGAHFNSFPFKPDPLAQDGGAPVWQKDPRLNAITLRELQGQNPDRWVQINHPDMTENFIDRDADGRVDGGYLTLGKLIDGVETQNYLGTDILLGAPYKIVKEPKTLARQIRYVREFIWLQLLNQGHKIWGVAVADAHTVHGNGVGSWRNYLPSSSDNPSEIDWREMVQQAKGGRLICTTGPFLSVETTDGTIAGGSTRASGSIDLKVQVQCTDWISIDRVQVLVNGAPRPDLNFTKKTHPKWFQDGVVVFDQTLTVPLSQDSHLIVVAYGEHSTLVTGYGSSAQATMHPCAYNNPIFIDVDGGGFTANGDTLGYPLPTKNLTIGQVQGNLEGGESTR